MAGERCVRHHLGAKQSRRHNHYSRSTFWACIFTCKGLLLGSPAYNYLGFWDQVTLPKQQFVYDAVRYLNENQIPGAIVEAGVWKGGTSARLASYARTRQSQQTAAQSITFPTRASYLPGDCGK